MGGRGGIVARRNVSSPWKQFLHSLIGTQGSPGKLNSFFTNKKQGTRRGFCTQEDPVGSFLISHFWKYTEVSFWFFFVFVFVFATLHSLQDLSSHTRDGTCALFSRSTDSYRIDCQGIPLD